MLIPNQISIKLQKTYQFSEQDIAKMNYTLSIFVCEISKFALLSAFFLSMGKFREFLIAVCILLPLRSICGGLHMPHYLSCLLCTFFFFSIPVLLLNPILIPYPVQVATLVPGIPAVFLTGPVPSAKRPLMTKARFQKIRLLSCVLIAANVLILLLFPSLPYRNLWYWLLVEQILQLIAARLLRKGKVTIE